MFLSYLLYLVIVTSVTGSTLYYEKENAPPVPPKTPNVYSMAGTIELPYAEISEPFVAFVDNLKQRSRIDYYGGVVQTYQVSAVNRSTKIVPVSTETSVNQPRCIDALFGGVQNMIPDLTYFIFEKSETIRGVSCNKFVNVSINFGRKDTYTMWLSQADGTPVRYDMIGYDSLLGSHYDRYYIEYATVDIKTVPADSLFVIPDVPCINVSGGGEHEMHPARELVHRDESGLHHHFNNFKTGKNYSSDVEARRRLHVFRQNLRFIHSHNRRGRLYRVGVNHLADRTPEELRKMLGYRPLSQQLKDKLPFQPFSMPLTTDVPPASWDWRIQGAVLPVKDQGICGSCWSFGTTGALEGAYFVQKGQRVRFSQQQLVDCSWGMGNNGCDGGDDFMAYNYIQKHGLSTEDQYGPYLMQDGFCHKSEVTLNLKGFVKVTANNSTALKQALVSKGPISVAIDAGHRSFVYYESGVYYEPACSMTNLDHAVLLVGYGSLGDKDYWLVKNSWSFYWGSNGYVLMAPNNCGVETSPTYPIVG